MQIYKKLIMLLVLAVFGSTSAAEKNYAPDITRWKTPQGFKLVRGEGPNGTPALYHQRQDKSYILAAVRLTGLKPRTKYRFGVKIKTRNVSTHARGNGATICIEFEKNNKYAGGGYPRGITGDRDWTVVSDTVTTPDGKFYATMSLYMRRGHTGEAWFAEPFIVEDKPEWYTELIYPRAKYAITPGKQRLVFHSHTVGLAGKQESVEVKISRDGKVAMQETIPVQHGQYAVEADLVPGNYTVESVLKHPDADVTLSGRTGFTVISKTSGARVKIDDRGRVIVDGKKFLPVGIFTNQTGKAFSECGNVLRREDIDRLKKSPFNCIMPYDGHYWKRESDGRSGMAVTREIMTELNDAGIKTIISLKDINNRNKGGRSIEGRQGVEAITEYVVTSLKDHPGLLAWYLNDESSVTEFRLNQRKKVSTLDPDHPTWQCQYDPAKFAMCAGGADIFGVDPYPVESPESDMMLIQRHFDALTFQEYNGGYCVWAIPQIFPWHNYSSVREYCLPTEKQMRSMNILMAIRGAKAFIFYSYMDLLNPGLLKRKDYDFDRHWQAVCNTARMLRDLSSYLLSDASVPQPVVNNQSKSPAVAAAFVNDDGKTAVLIAATGSGACQAEITVKGKANLKSRFGNTVNLGNGVYRFTGENMDSDILFE